MIDVQVATAAVGYAWLKDGGERERAAATEGLVGAGVARARVFLDCGPHAARPGLKAALAAAAPAAAFIVSRLDQLGATSRDALNVLGRVRAAGAVLVLMEPPLDGRTEAGALTTAMLAALAALDRSKAVATVATGLERARERGVVTGRKKAMTPARVGAARKLLKDQERSYASIAREIGVSRATFSTWMREDQSAGEAAEPTEEITTPS